ALRVDGDPQAFALLDLLQQLQVDAGLVVDVAVGIRAGDHPRADLLELFDGVDGDVARTGDDAGLPLDALSACPQHLPHEEDRAVARGLLPHDRAAPAEPLARQYAGLVLLRDALVHAEEVADLAA